MLLSVKESFKRVLEIVLYIDLKRQEKKSFVTFITEMCKTDLV